MKEKLLALLASSRGRFIVAVTAFITGGLTQLITSKGYQLPADTAVQISAIVALGVGWALDRLAATINNTGIEKIQDAMPSVLTDGGAGPKTISGAQQLAAGVEDVQTPAGSYPLSLAEGRIVKDNLFKITQRRPDLAAALRAEIERIAPVFDKGAPGP